VCNALISRAALTIDHSFPLQPVYAGRAARFAFVLSRDTASSARLIAILGGLWHAVR
jgi:hypothetical protein